MIKFILMELKTFSHPELLKKLPDEVKILFEIFGDQIRLVGGCVRDLLLEKSLNDFDFATTTLPQQTIKILEKNKIKAVPTGVKFGTVTAVINGKNFEITTLRKDNETDGRHCNPEFVDDFYFDAARRDFTINALYLDSKGVVTDYFDGISDLKKAKVRFIGDAENRISEDFLRILRFFRFSCEYAKDIDAVGLEACFLQRKNLSKLSRERIRMEFLKMLSSTKKENLLVILGEIKSKKIAHEIFTQSLDIKALERLFDLENKLQFSATLKLKIASLFCDKNLDTEIFFKEICATNIEKKYFTAIYESAAKDLSELLLDYEKDVVLEIYLLTLVKSKTMPDLAQIKQDFTFLQNFSLPPFPLQTADLIEKGFVGKSLGDAVKSSRKIWAESGFKMNAAEILAYFK